MSRQPTIPPLRTGDTRKPAPGELELLQAFINTLEPDEDIEDFADPASLERWLVHYELMSAPHAALTAADLEHVRTFREALRAVLIAKNGGPDAAAAADTLNGAAERAELIVHFDGEGAAALVPVRRGPAEAIARLLAIVERAQATGTWDRMKGCPDSGCGWIFYDWSKNRSATWCSMETCGNRAKARAFRERKRGHTRTRRAG